MKFREIRDQIKQVAIFLVCLCAIFNSDFVVVIRIFGKWIGFDNIR